jgi:hypothetical protein
MFVELDWSKWVEAMKAIPACALGAPTSTLSAERPVTITEEACLSFAE